jgi:hypothetical protein
MDTTEKYIKMCQEAWPDLKREIKIGDLMMVVGDSDPARCVGIHASLPDKFGEVAKYQYLSPFQKFLAHNKNNLTINNPVYYGYVGHTFIVWTQGQLQEMVYSTIRKKGLSLIGMFSEFYDFCSDNEYHGWLSDDGTCGTTPERMWLAFVMHENYDRIWVNKKEIWEKVP